MPRASKHRPLCFRCEMTLAKWPASRPIFCTVKCGYLYAKEITALMAWCEKHGWYNADVASDFEGSCPDCGPLEEGECPLCGCDECECHETITEMPGHCPKD